MSEVNNNAMPEELVEEIEYEVEDAEVIPTPIDPTLSIEGEAADAKATGDAIDAVLDDVTINGNNAVNKAFTIYAGDILISNASGAQTIAQALEDIGDKDASEIMYDTTNLVSVKDAIDEINDSLDTGITEEEIDDIIDEVFGEDDE